MVHLAGMLCHGDMDDILGFGEFFGKKSLVIFHVRRQRETFLSAGHMGEQIIGRYLEPIQKASLLRADVVRAYGDAEPLFQGFREITYAVGGDGDRETFGLLKDQYILSDLLVSGIVAQRDHVLRQNAEDGCLE